MDCRRSSISFVLLLALGFWATGAACFLHERLEHSECASSSHDGHSQGVADDLGSSLPSGDGDHPAHHDHDHCPTCLVLASLKADSTSFACPLVATLAPCGDMPIAHGQFHKTFAHISLPPARAPPSVHA